MGNIHNTGILIIHEIFFSYKNMYSLLFVYEHKFAGGRSDQCQR